MKLIRRKDRDKPNQVLLQHDPVDRGSLLSEMARMEPMERAYPVDRHRPMSSDVFEALSFLARWYNSDQYAGMEHDRGRDSGISGRHMLQTPYGRSRVGERDVPYNRAVNLAYSDRLDENASLPPRRYGEYKPYEELVNIDRWTADKPSSLVHELYHAAEGVMNPWVSDPKGGLSRESSVDRRFIDPNFITGESSSIYELGSMDRFRSSNPYTPEQWADKNFNREYETLPFEQYVTLPSEVSARLRQIAFEAQRQGLLEKGDFKLNDDILKALEDNPLGAARQLLEYFTPEERQLFYNNL